MLNESDCLKIPVKYSGAPVSLATALLKAGVPLNLQCGGNGVCGRCLVRRQGREVLACQTLVTENVTIEVPFSSLTTDGEMAVESAFAPPVPRPARPRCRRVTVHPARPREEPGTDDWQRLLHTAFPGAEEVRAGSAVLRALPALVESEAEVRLTVLDGEVVAAEDAARQPVPLPGAAVDVGTTTVAVALLELAGGRRLALKGGRNRQASLGVDVISRIARGSTPEGLRSLRKLLVEETIVPLLQQAQAAAGLTETPLQRLVVGGNTTMIHLLLGLPPKGLGEMPFNAVILAPPPSAGKEIGLPVEQVEFLPAAGAYFGGDVVGGAYAVGLDRPGPPEMLVDVGTNGEMLLRVGERLLGTSTAAGPAFEGYGLSCGGPAVRGAVVRLRCDPPEFKIETYGSEKPSHLCGSAYVDFLAEGRRCRFLTEHGRFVANSPAAAVQPPLPTDDGEAARRGRRCRAADGIFVDEADVGGLLQAKAAILAGASILLRTAGLAPEELHALHLAGGFGRGLSVENALRIGLLPQVSPEKIRVVGNTSLAAASGVLVNAGALGKMRRLAQRIELVELNLEPDFQERYIEALALP